MATKAAYYSDDDQTPEIPTPGGDYSAPTAHAANASHQIFQAPSSMPTTNPPPSPAAGLDAIDHPPTVTRPGGK
jgi:hypothetical protein